MGPQGRVAYLDPTFLEVVYKFFNVYVSGNIFGERLVAFAETTFGHIGPVYRRFDGIISQTREFHALYLGGLIVFLS